MKRTLRVLAVFVTALALISASAVRNEALAKKEKPPKNAPAPAAGAIARSFPNSILGAAKLQSKPHPDRKSLLIDVSELLIRDLPGFAPGLSQAYQPTNYSFDKEKSAIRDVKDFGESCRIEIA